MMALRGVLGALLFSYLALLVLMFFAQRYLVFAPDTQRVNPASVGLTNVQEVELQLADGSRLYSWYVAAATGKPTIYYMHGNGGSVGTRRNALRRLMAGGHGLFVLGYPGYGGSEGSPTEQSLVEAAHRGYEYLRRAGVAASDLVLFGQSLGTAVAVQLASAEPARCLILAAPMSSARSVGQAQYPFLPVGLLMKDPFLSSQFVPRIGMPLMIVHGDEDRVIPIDEGRKLFAAAVEPKRFHRVEGGGHNNLYSFALADLVHEFAAGC